MILQLEFLILDEMRDALNHYHFVRAVLEQDFLVLECYDFLGCLSFLGRKIRENIIFHDSEVKIFW
jgi:hypothetical protein